MDLLTILEILAIDYIFLVPVIFGALLFISCNILEASSLHLGCHFAATQAVRLT